VKVLHSVKEDDPVGMPQIRFAALLEPPQDDAIRVGNRLAWRILPISNRHPIGFTWRL
jgi:hypothetical protein